MSEFFQDGPTLGNQFLEDRVLQSLLKRKFPAEMYREIEPDLKRLGERAVTDIWKMGVDAEAQIPTLTQFDPWGRRIDEINTGWGWKALDRVSAEEGIVAIGYERKFGALSRLYQFSKLYLFHPSSAIYSCPLAMTDGAARAIEIYGDEALKKGAYKHLTSRNPAEFWTSGQWMTEKTGGSDVGDTQTEAKMENGQFRLYGTKWFTSATTSQMAMALARTPGAPTGGRGLSLFYIELRDAKGQLQNIEVHRLKDKLGTKALPTAELTLRGTPAKLVGDEGNGVKKISSLFNVTRLYNATCAVGNMRRGVALARDYAKKRRAFGKLLSDHPLHLETLSWMQTEFEASFHLTFYAVELLGKDELGTATPEESATLRLLMPVAKLFTAKQGVALASETLEAFGGAGYIENTGLPKLLRDGQVLSIWEGTTNVLSLDMLRAIEKENAFEACRANVRARLAALSTPELAPGAAKVSEALKRLEHFLPLAAKAGADGMQTAARAFAFGVARTVSASLLLEHAAWSLRAEGDRRALASALRFCAQDLTVGLEQELLSGEHHRENMTLALD